MIEKRLVQWYAADSGVDLDIAEREIALTYVLRVLSDQGLLDQLAFKGGTALRKIHLGATGRFSLDLDFTAASEMLPDELVLDLAAALHGRTHYGLAFTIPSPDYYATADSCGAEVTYSHDWLAAGRFGLQVSFRARPLLPIRSMPLRHERYFDWLGVIPPLVPSLDLHEMIGEKVQAAAQRSRVRDLYDLSQLARQPCDRGRGCCLLLSLPFQVQPGPGQQQSGRSCSGLCLWLFVSRPIGKDLAGKAIGYRAERW
jgi:predicted nucleotidyltransferase component of viral defense system